ncbi:MAG TPA: hypothetical protein VLV50_18560 [Stellaceae bacterium]|nr:hypothetical protein [Stellaceae bacterium]
MTAWVLAATLAAFLLLMVALYRRNLSDFNHLLTFMLFVLMNEDVYRAQREGLLRLITTTSAANAMDLNIKVRRSATQLANKLSSDIGLACHAAIWEIRQRRV